MSDHDTSETKENIIDIQALDGTPCPVCGGGTRYSRQLATRDLILMCSVCEGIWTNFQEIGADKVILDSDLLKDYQDKGYKDLTLEELFLSDEEVAEKELEITISPQEGV